MTEAVNTDLRLKTPEEQKAEQVRQYVDEYAALSLEAERIKGRMDWLKGYFETLATADLKDTKLLTAFYWGSQNSRVTVTNASTVKPVSLTMVKKLLGEISGDFIKTEITDTMTAPCKKLLAMAAQGNYTEGSLESVIEQISADPKIQATLRKKLKGRWDKDKAMLMKVAGLPEQEASDWAYLAAEVINWEWLTQVLKAASWEGSPQEAIDIIRAAVIVEESIKVGIEAEKPEV
ncbi:MAG: hypothetical protein K1W04_08465 [Oscillospiraceae bacterium]